MAISIREATAADAPELGRICFEGFRAISAAHNYPMDFPSAEAAQGMLAGLIPHPHVFSVVAESGGRIVGSNFLDERGPIFGIGPITVDPTVQDDGVGRELMGAVLERWKASGSPGVRLVQAAWHRRSLALYLKLGFEVREPLACLQGPPIGEEVPGCAVRAASADDIEACNALCYRVHGHARAGEVAEAVAQGAAKVVLRGGRITGYATGIAYFGHAVGETSEDVQALIGAAEAFGGPGFIAPLRNGELMRWCLERGLKVVQALTLMSIGLYGEPEGAWLPTILY
jgi:predicted N-acetyltransferase YhbS